VIDGPGFRNAGRQESPVSLIDLPPTILAACGLDVPQQMQGRSLTRLLAGEAWPNEVYIEISEDHIGRAIRDRRWKYSVAAPKEHCDDHGSSDLYVEDFLYDLESDPYEQNNLIAASGHQKQAAQMRQRLLRRIESVEGRAVTIQPADA
jgi:arylsulfatase A-like enzyme